MRKARQYRGGYQFSGLKELVRELRKTQTSAEALLWELIRNRRLLGFKFRRQHQFGDYVADFYCHEAELVIECDGPVHQPNEQWHHDQNRDAYMIAQGLRVLRFTNDQIFNDTEKVLEEIAALLPSPIGRGAGGEGAKLSAMSLFDKASCSPRQPAVRWEAVKPSPQPSPRGRGSLKNPPCPRSVFNARRGIWLR